MLQNVQLLMKPRVRTTDALPHLRQSCKSAWPSCDSLARERKTIVRPSYSCLRFRENPHEVCNIVCGLLNGLTTAENRKAKRSYDCCETGLNRCSFNRLKYNFINIELKCATNENSEKPFASAQSDQSIWWALYGKSMAQVSSGGKLRLWSDCADARADLNICCMYIPTSGTLHVLARMCREPSRPVISKLLSNAKCLVDLRTRVFSSRVLELYERVMILDWV